MRHDDELDAELLGIQQRFVERLKAYIEELRPLQAALLSPETSPAACREIYTIAHRLHGTAKTIGFGKLGDLSADLELTVKQALAAAALPNMPDIHALLGGYIAEIEAVIGQFPARP